jgi:hypothetical protein
MFYVKVVDLYRIRFIVQLHNDVFNSSGYIAGVTNRRTAVLIRTVKVFLEDRNSEQSAGKHTMQLLCGDVSCKIKDTLQF